MIVKPDADDIGGNRHSLTLCDDKTNISFWTKYLKIYGPSKAPTVNLIVDRHRIKYFKAYYAEKGE